jgi:hypothetical protein
VPHGPCPHHTVRPAGSTGTMANTLSSSVSCSAAAVRSCHCNHCAGVPLFGRNTLVEHHCRSSSPASSAYTGHACCVLLGCSASREDCDMPPVWCWGCVAVGVAASKPSTSSTQWAQCTRTQRPPRQCWQQHTSERGLSHLGTAAQVQRQQQQQQQQQHANECAVSRLGTTAALGQP